jgi:DNA-directed RNA polymerase sigma subunit (sigma70/sigma32)
MRYIDYGRLIASYVEGEPRTLAQVGREFGIAESTVCKILQRHDVPCRFRRRDERVPCRDHWWRDDRDAALIADYLSNPPPTLQDLAYRYELTRERVRQILKHKGHIVPGGRQHEFKRERGELVKQREAAAMAERRAAKAVRLAEAIALYDSGLSLKRVGEQMHMSREAVRDLFSRNGHPRRAVGVASPSSAAWVAARPE